ncbi:MAG TPA: YciI family protein [Acidimicrobiales bacterium]|nr:YciI family protein [Acidimicrobiales bacterium]
MRFMLLQNYGGIESDCAPMYEWTPEEVTAHIQFQQALNRQLEELGELIDAQGLAGPDEARSVVSDGITPLVTDGPFPESKELLAGYRVVEVDTPERAVEIAALISAAPGQGGAPIRQRIEVRQVMSAPDPEV